MGLDRPSNPLCQVGGEVEGFRHRLRAERGEEQEPRQSRHLLPQLAQVQRPAGSLLPLHRPVDALLQPLEPFHLSSLGLVELLKRDAVLLLPRLPLLFLAGVEGVEHPQDEGPPEGLVPVVLPGGEPDGAQVWTALPFHIPPEHL